ncbi:MAG: UDP-N-acetylglucosamine 2-epimerase (non-hydrolyzing) [Desulfobacterales bacterium]|nr:UDP-N-acetylglucosamine 2-epimerase (non-hydrolyzing) [Desulfobacterales bacterium]
MKREVKTLDSSSLDRKIAVIVGTRPGIVMFAPIIHELQKGSIPHIVIHTGQHYSPNMDAQFFTDLELPEPQYHIEGVADKKTHGAQTAAMLEGIERVLLKEKPSLVLVGGDANTNLAGALAARKLRMQVGHMEAGERSFDWRMPEEHNRRMIDHISEHLFATGEKAEKHLLKESVQGKIYIIGNPIVDASIQHLTLAKKNSDALERLKLKAGGYALLTTHREENVDFQDLLRNILEGVSRASEALNLPILFLCHPRTLKRLKEFELWDWVNALPGLHVHEAVGYLDFLNLIAHARLVFTDSGGVQQEACIHHVAAVTLRENTEWTETLSHGANRLAGTDPQRIVAASQEAVRTKREWPVPFGDGSAAAKIVDICIRIISS